MATAFSSFLVKKRECMFMLYRVMAKLNFWLVPEIELAKNYQYSRIQLKEIESLIEVHYNELISAWKLHFER